MFILLFLISFLIETAENNFYLTLFDSNQHEYRIELNAYDLNFFSTLKSAYEDTQDNTSLLPLLYDGVSYETFNHILKPLVDQFKDKDIDYSITMLEEKIRKSKTLLSHTMDVINWMVKNNISKDNAQAAYDAAEYLNMPFAIKKGIANYCYDLGLPVFKEVDNKENKNSLLISNQDFDISPTLKNETDRFNFFCSLFDYSNKEIRFFDSSRAALVEKDGLPNSLYCYFDFSNNKIQFINLNDLTKTIGDLDLKSRTFGISELSASDHFAIQGDKPIFDFQKNTILNLSNGSHTLKAINFSEHFKNLIESSKDNYEKVLLNFNKKKEVQKRLFFSRTMYHFVITYLFSSGLVYYIKGRNNFIKNSFGLSMLGVVFQFRSLYKSFKNSMSKIKKTRDISKKAHDDLIIRYNRLLADEQGVVCYLVDNLYYIIVDKAITLMSF